MRLKMIHLNSKRVVEISSQLYFSAVRKLWQNKNEYSLLLDRLTYDQLLKEYPEQSEYLKKYEDSILKINEQKTESKVKVTKVEEEAINVIIEEEKHSHEHIEEHKEKRRGRKSKNI